jgi:RNA polymerase sigma-70 factor (ECF subfamily)
MSDEERRRRFELLVLPHLDSGLNLARWLTHDDHDAQDVVQEAIVRAIRFIDGFRGDNARAWLLQIVRNTCFSWLKENRPAELMAFDDADGVLDEIAAPAADEPPSIAMRNADRQRINAAIASLPVVYREVLLLRELEDFSYKEIARIVDIPMGTVMSRLARARGLLHQALLPGARPAPRAMPRSIDGEWKR